jgi:coenzyme F420-reducing hydrogenase gamma subunit
VNEYISIVYAHPEYIDTLATSTPVKDHVQVDFELRGCPINKYQMLEMVSALLNGRKPNIPTYSVCVECKHRGISCVMVARGIQCMGPVTQAGCNAICPAHNRGCFGCYGPMETPNPPALSEWWRSQLGVEDDNIVRSWRGFNAYAEELRKESEVHVRK